jgi:hypothetical protein
MVTVAVVFPALIVIGDAVMCNPLDHSQFHVNMYGTVNVQSRCGTQLRSDRYRRNGFSIRL